FAFFAEPARSMQIKFAPSASRPARKATILHERMNISVSYIIELPRRSIILSYFKRTDWSKGPDGHISDIDPCGNRDFTWLCVRLRRQTRRPGHWQFGLQERPEVRQPRQRRDNGCGDVEEGRLRFGDHKAQFERARHAQEPA